MRLVLIILLSSLASAQGMGGKSGIGGKAGFGGGTGGTNPTLVTDVSNTGACQSTATCATAAFTPSAGDAIIVFMQVGSGSAVINAPTDTCGTSGGATNTYTSLATNAVGFKGALFVTIVGFGKSCVVTETWGGTFTGGQLIYAQDWAGVNGTTPVVAASIGNINTPGTTTDGISSSVGTGSTISGTQTNNDVAGGVIECQGFSDVFTAGTGYTLAATHTVVGNCVVAGEWKAATSAVSAASATFTSNAGTGSFYYTFAAVVQHP